MHRAINTGNIELKLLCVCRADSGHDYNAIMDMPIFIFKDLKCQRFALLLEKAQW